MGGPSGRPATGNKQRPYFLVIFCAMFGAKVWISVENWCPNCYLLVHMQPFSMFYKKTHSLNETFKILSELQLKALVY